MPRLIVLDGHTLNPGDLSWQPLSDQGELIVYDRSAPEEVIPRAAGAPVVFTNKVTFSAEVLAALPDLRYIGVTATGVNVVDLAAAKARGVVVTNVPGYGAASVAQHTIALLLEAANHVGAHAAAVRAGAWTRSPDWCFTVAPLVELAGKTFGIIGLGSIGRRVAALAHALGMPIAAAPRPGLAHGARSDLPGLPGVPIGWLELDDLFAAADVLSLHCPLTEQTHHLVNAARLARMKPTAILLNTARGALIDEPALAAALREDRLAAAALDVLSAEPPPADHPLLSAPRCLLTPHCAWASRESRQRLLDQAAANLRAFLAGKPVNVVNP